MYSNLTRLESIMTRSILYIRVTVSVMVVCRVTLLVLIDVALVVAVFVVA